jgi:hypothetical protein
MYSMDLERFVNTFIKCLSESGQLFKLKFVAFILYSIMCQGQRKNVGLWQSKM